MINSKYLAEVYHVPFDQYNGLYVARHYRDPHSSRFICSYNDGKNHKNRLFQFFRRCGQNEIQRDWELHHIVEGQHFADIDFSGRLSKMYANELPCVLIHKEEHRAYNRLLHIKETDELYRDQLPKDMLRRSQQAAASAQDKSQQRKLQIRLKDIEHLYLDTYCGDPVLQRVAQNVINEAKELVR